VSQEADIFLPRKKGYVVLDIESQGYLRFCPIEISVVKFSPKGRCLGRFSSFIRPSASKLNPRVTKLTGITIDMVRNAPEPKNVFVKVREFVRDSIVVGHAVGENDIPIVNHFYNILFHTEFTNPYVDTFYWAQQLYPELGNGHYNLRALAEHFSINTHGFHRAEEDCFTTGHLYQILLSAAESLTDSERDRVLSDFAHKNDPKEKADKAPLNYTTFPLYQPAAQHGEKDVAVTLWTNRRRNVMRLKFHRLPPEHFISYMSRHPQFCWHEASDNVWVAEKIPRSQAHRVLYRLRHHGFLLFRQGKAHEPDWQVRNRINAELSGEKH
jgi:DNA polymerase III epsilon subunit family exonuclease